MGGVYIAILLSLVSFCVAALSVAKDALWSKPPVPEWIGWVALCAIVIALALAAAVLLCAFRLGPNWMRRTVETLLSPADLKAYPDMPIRKVCERISPDLGRGLN